MKLVCNFILIKFFGIFDKLYFHCLFSLLGHNGAGKTTLINLLTGLLEKSAGKIKSLLFPEKIIKILF